MFETLDAVKNGTYIPTVAESAPPVGARQCDEPQNGAFGVSPMVFTDICDAPRLTIGDLVQKYCGGRA